MKIHIVDQAEDDLAEGHNFYEDQAPGLGVYFLDCIYSDVESLALYAKSSAFHTSINNDCPDCSSL